MSINDPRRTNRFEDEEVAKERRPNRVYFLSNTYTPSSTRRDCSIISISRVNRCNPLGPWPRFRGTVLRVRPRGGGGGVEQCGATRNVQKVGKVTALSPREEEGESRQGKQKEESHRSRESRSLQKRRRGGVLARSRAADENGGRVSSRCSSARGCWRNVENLEYGGRSTVILEKIVSSFALFFFLLLSLLPRVQRACD